MSALVEGNSLPEPQRSQRAGAPAVAAVTPGIAAGRTDAVWTMEARLRSGVGCVWNLSRIPLSTFQPLLEALNIKLLGEHILGQK